MEENQLVYKTNCPTCLSNKYKVIFANIKDQDDYGNLLEKPFKDLKFVVVRCNSCSTTYLQVRPNDKCIGRYYEGEYHCYKSFSSRGFLMNIFSKVSGKLIANSLRKKINKSSTDKHYLLDYGCGSGNWINILKNEFKNWKFAGTEVTTQAVDLARLNDIDCYKSDENDLLEFFEENSVDVVNLFHVIEHIPDPLKALKVLKKILVPGGIIIGQTPNIDSWDAKLFGKNWSQLHIPRHMTLYSPKTLRIHAIKSGMNLIDISSTASSATNWSASLLKVFNSIRRSTKHPSNMSIYPVLIILFLPIVFIQSLFSYTSNVDFVFQKPLNE